MWRGYLIKATAALVATINFCSCSSGSKSENQARELFERANSCYKANPDSALHLLDALSKRYPDSISLLRAALHLRTQINEVAIARQIVENDSILAAETAIKESLAPKFRWIYEKGMIEGFWVEKSLGGTLEQGTAFQPRIDKYNEIFIATIASGKNLGYKTMTVACGGKSFTAHSTQNESFDGREFVTFHGNECDSICRLLAESPEAAAAVTFSGKRTFSFKLAQNVKSAAANTYRYNNACKLVRHATGKHTYLVEKQKINRKQIEETQIK